MYRLHSAVVIAALAAAFAAPFAVASDDADPVRTNVLLIIADDLNNDLACYGQRVETPNLERLAARGVRFDRAYCQFPLCNPSRTSFLSGKYPTATQVHDNDTQPRVRLAENVFLPEYFGQNGYFTARVGKVAHESFERAVRWNVSEASKKGDGYRAGIVEADPQDPNSYWERTDNADDIEPDGLTAVRVAELLDQHHAEPFFIAAGFKKPHRPWPAPAKYFDLYAWSDIQFRVEPPNDRDDIPLVALLGFRKGGHVAPEPPRPIEIRQKTAAAYWATISFVDAQIGRLFDVLDRHGLWEHTVVVFASDHGYHLGEHGGLWHKMSLFEEAARVPLIVAAPGKKAGVASAGIVELVDLYPTLVDLCDLPPNADLDGRSFAHLLSDPSAAGKQAAFTMLLRDGPADVTQGNDIFGWSLRTDRFRYTEWEHGHGAELYDHAADPFEYKNLAAEPEYSDVVSDLARQLKSYRTD